MCFDPISLAITAAATAATYGGNRLNQIASNKAVKGQIALEQGRQKIYQRDADQNFNDVLGRFSNVNNKAALDKAQQDRTSTIEGNLAAPDMGNYDSVTAGQPQVVKSTLAKTLGEQVAKSKDQAKRLAALGATGELDAGNAINLARAGSKSAMIGDFSKRSAGVSAAEQAAAAQKRSGIGDALGLVGTGLNMYNMVSAPGRMGDSLLGGSVSPPTPGFVGPMPYSPYAKVTNLFTGVI